LAGLKRAAEASLPYATWTCVGLLGLSVFLLRNRNLSDLLAICLVLTAGLIAAGGQTPRALARGTGLWLGGGVLLIVAGALLGPMVSADEGVLAFQALVLIACFVLTASEALRRIGPLRLLSLLFAAGAISAAASIAIHLSTGHPLTERVVMIGRANNPIPAAGVMAAAALAGVGMLRAGELSHRWRAALLGLLVIIAAMVLSQSRGPFIGLMLGGAMLFLPAAWVRRTWILAPLIFVGASCLVLLEEPVRSLFCQSDQLLCRPSHRLDLWSHSLQLIASQPLFGMGVTHRLGEGAFNNPQNAVLATAVYFGLPFLIAALVGAGLILRRQSRVEPTPPIRWAAAMLVFSAAYFAFEPSPFAFYNAHYLFLWLPVAVLLAVPGMPLEAQLPAPDPLAPIDLD
jgi:hypothetical protein